MNILLIEDSVTTQRQLKEILEQDGHAVTVAVNGELAVQMMDISPADLIICDIGLPGLDGYETVNILREALGRRWVPIIFCTAKENAEDVINGFKAGADDYLIKPVDTKLLLAKLKVMRRFIRMQEQLEDYKNAPKTTTQFDELTGVYKPNYFLDHAMLQWSILSRQSLPSSVLIVEIDSLVAYREYYGKSEAKMLQQKIGESLLYSAHRPGDFVGLFQDENFVLMLPNTGNSGSEILAKRILANIESLSIEHKGSPTSGQVTVSIGGATCFRLRETPLVQTISLAQQALNDVLLDGGNRYEIRKLVTAMSLSKPSFRVV